MGSPLSVIKDNLEKLSSYLKMRPVQKPRLLSKLEYLSAKLHLFLEKLKKAKPFWMELTALNANSKETLLMHVVQSTICKPSTDVTKPLALKAKLQRFRMNSLVSRPASRVKKHRKLLWKVKLERSMQLLHRWRLRFRTKKES